MDNEGNPLHDGLINLLICSCFSLPDSDVIGVGESFDETCIFIENRLHLNQESSLKDGHSRTLIFERRNGVTTL